ncbi:hypothetical protein FC756_09210 [Lysinibacillus mangiferihumi]|uniref:Uncharacterized protein n=1 Tax=Lysinibacillus mangiferihumi TaxID=1130819 RepID=A0A4U2Z5I4_9BACI|nr:hypothetical protein [Lysinibacillus mangiferihumi]TKI69438.1 hypothetical protein FC756_09210 [Lysinibacillus mangiferihumi]
MQIIPQFKHNLIKKALKRYRYDEVLNQFDTKEDFYADYSFFTREKNLKKNINTVYATLSGTPKCNHIAAKNLLFQGNDDCWKFFDRTAQFFAYSYTGGSLPFIDPIAPLLNYALYVERIDLIELLLTKAATDLERDEYKNNNEYIKQKVYPSTYLIHFLIEQLGIPNPVKDKVMQYGDGLGIYERIVDEWDHQFNEIDDEYWNSLCEYHLNGIGVTGTKWKDEEFLYFGLVPMELINLFKVRQKLGLAVPDIKHELFSTPMANYPTIPTGYNPDIDVKFQLVERTKNNAKVYTFEDIVEQLKKEHGEEANLFY